MVGSGTNVRTSLPTVNLWLYGLFGVSVWQKVPGAYTGPLPRQFSPPDPWKKNQFPHPDGDNSPFDVGPAKVLLML